MPTKRDISSYSLPPLQIAINLAKFAPADDKAIQRKLAGAPTRSAAHIASDFNWNFMHLQADSTKPF